METSGGTAGFEYRFGDVVIDRSTFSAVKAGTAVTLTPRAFDVLIYLIENRDRVVGKQELFEEIWKEAFVTDNALMRAIKEVRRAIGDNASSPVYIETVHKRGYRFIADVAVEQKPERSDAAPNFISETADGHGPLGTLPQLETNGKGLLNGKRRRSFTILPYLIAALILASGFGFLAMYRSEPATQIKSIAVLPFANESGDPDLDYLSDGMSEALISSLSQLPDVSVKSRSTVFRYKGRAESPANIGTQLKVQAVLTGRVIQRGDDIAVYLSLVDTENENNLWSKQYSRKAANLFALQSEIARDVAASLGAKLYGIAERQITRNYTDNLEAYHLYLRGRYHVLTTRNQGAETGIGYFKQAIEIDPNFALAYAGLAGAAVGRALGSESVPDEVFREARAFALKAVELDEGLSDGHVAVGSVSMWYDWDWVTAERHLTRAIQADPNNADAHLALGVLLCNQGRRDEGLAELRRSVEIDPLNLRNIAVEAQFLSFAGRTDDALASLRRSVEMSPNFYVAYVFIATALIEKQMYSDAVAEARKAQSQNPVASIPVALQAYALAKDGKTNEARRLLNGLLERSKKEYVAAHSIALIYSALGENEKALDWLERGIEQRDLRMTFVNVDPKWNGLRGEPRFAEILRHLGFSKNGG
ncbi:MAG: winged helix-turn-helix domain-containing protein [Acidobacteria bacterium]|nr:winged helix-turn-helix domain-containing protein [Acidobacteriota bacterium]